MRQRLHLASIWCWGANYVHQVMASHVDAYATRVRIPLPLAATDVAVSDAESCARLSGACWGSSLEIEYGFEIGEFAALSTIGAGSS